MVQEATDAEVGAVSRRDVLKGAAAGAAVMTGFTLGVRASSADAHGPTAGEGAVAGSDDEDNEVICA